MTEPATTETDSTTTATTTPVTPADRGYVGDGVVRSMEDAQALVAEALGDEVPEGEATPAEPTAEAPAESPPPPTKAELKSKAIADRARRDAEFHRQKREVEAKAKRLAEIEDLTAKVKAGEADPDDLLGQFGVDYRTVVEAKLKAGKKEPTELEVMKSRVEALETQIREKEAALEAKQLETQRATATQDAVSQIKAALDAHGDRFDAITAYGAHADVLKVMQEHLLQTATEFDEHGRPIDGEVLTPDAAADIVEQRLAAILERGMSTKYARRHQPSTPSGTTAPRATANASRTLTNGHGVTGAAPRSKDGVPEFDTVEEARRHLSALLGS